MDLSGRILITVDDWFIAPDGQQYRAVWGDACVVPAADLLGLKPSQSANWFVSIGDVLIAGCRIHYAVRCNRKPLGRDVYDATVSAAVVRAAAE